MSDYNNGEIRGWNGGECPVHPKSEVTVWFRGYFESFNGSAGQLGWGRNDANSDIVCFQVTKPYVEPKTIWVNEWPNGGVTYPSEEEAKRWSNKYNIRIAVEYVEKQK